MPLQPGTARKNARWALIALLVCAFVIPLVFSWTKSEAPELAGEATTWQQPQDAGQSEPGSESSHQDPFSFILFELFVIVGVAMMGRWLALKFRQPAVLGELTLGVVLGNIGYWIGAPMAIVIMQLGNMTPLFSRIWSSNASVAEAARVVFPQSQMVPGGEGAELLQIITGPEAPHYVLMALALWLFSNLGVILLLFMVGLESRVEEMLRVGFRASLVAMLGVAAPFLMGYGASLWLVPEAETPVHLFLGATLCATSVGITARVFKDLGKLKTGEARVILGAAVIDDILGLILLAIVSGIVVTGDIHLSEILRITVLSVLFLGAVIIFGDRFVRLCVPLVVRLDRHHSKLLFPLTLAFAMSWLANQIELATIVGAFAAGLILNEEHFSPHLSSEIRDSERAREHTIEELIGPLETIFAPIFFVLIGMQVNLASLSESRTVWLALGFTLVAILGKVVAGLPAGSGLDRLSVGLGMIPRGEVGLIFASIGKGLGVVTDALFSAIVIMVIVTTLITPLLLRWSLFRDSSSETA